MFKGDRDVSKATLDPVYEKIQALLAHPGANEDQRKAGSNARDIVLRLRFWPVVRARFGAEYASQLKTAYDAVGVPMPDWSTMTRVGLKQHIEQLNKAIESHPDQAAAKEALERLVKRGLNGLDPKVIKSDWI